MSEDLSVEQIIESVETSTNNDIPMTAPETSETQAQETQQTPQEQFYEFNADGRNIKIPQNDPRVKQWLQMGYSAPQRMGQLNSQIQKYETQIKDFEGRFKSYEPYQKIDEWARQNPDKWALIEQTYQSQLQNTPTSQLPPEIRQELNEVKQFINHQQEKEAYQRQQAADQGYIQSVESLRKEYPQIDFYTPDQNGDSLEAKILDHALQNGIPNFKAAFRDYFHDNLMKMSEERGREATGKSLARAKNLGLQGKSPAPSAPRTPPNLRNLNYDQIDELIKAEYGLG